MTTRPSFGSLENARRSVQEHPLEYATQPIRRFEDGLWHPRRVEWLVRPQKHWQLNPGHFIHGLISIGLHVELDIRVIRDAIFFLSRNPGLSISVNVSADGICSQDLGEAILAKLSEHRVEGERLFLEVTEHRPIKSAESMIEQSDQLREAGVHIGLDHVGIAPLHVPLSLMELGCIDYLKLDARVATRSDGQLDLLIRRARQLDIDLVVEGIENSKQCERLAELGIDMAQGYYWDIPEVEAFNFSEYGHRAFA